MNLKWLYKLPWTEENNPNGWIEPTTFCQLKCPGCYRWIDKWNVISKHISIDILKKQIDNFIKKRNVQTISIAWWEPLLYPNIFELIRYIKSKKLFSKIYTNWIALSKNFLEKLKKSWITEIVIHIDMFQNIPDWIWKNEIELNSLRQKYIDLFKEISWINLGFIMPISSKNIIYLEDLLKFFRSNIETINLIVFSIYKDSNWDEEKNFNIEKLIIDLKEKINYEPCAYLNKIKDKNKIAWIFQNWFWNNDEYFWNIWSNLYKKINEIYYKKWWKFFITKKHKIIKLINFLHIIFYKNWFKIIKNILLSKNKKIFNQTLLIINPPDKMWDWCEWCPDIMYLWDRLFPSCLINNFKEFKTEFIKDE